MNSKLLRESWLGPLPGWELVRLARRGQVSRARLMVLYFLFIAFIIAPVMWFTRIDPISLFLSDKLTVSIPELASFSDRLSSLILGTVLLSVVAIAPGYAAAGIAEEKDRRTLELLLTSGLSDREIVVGKAYGRFVFVLGAAIGALPILAVTTLFGGVSWQFLVGGVLLVASTSALAIAIGIHSACVTPDLRSALMRAYAVTAIAMVATLFGPPCMCFIDPLAGMLTTGSNIGEDVFFLAAACAYALILSTISLFILRRATRQLRTVERRPDEPAPAKIVSEVERKSSPSLFDEVSIPAFNEPTRMKPVRESVWTQPDDFDDRPKPPIYDDDPLLWKERYVSGLKNPEFNFVFNRVVGVVAVALMVIGLMMQKTGTNWIALIANTASNWMFLSQLVVGMSAAVARERQRHTLDGLRGIPIDSKVLLSTKAKAVIERCWAWVLLSLLTGFGAFYHLDITVAIAVSCFLLAGFVLVLGLGTLLTVRCATELKAFRYLMPFAVIVLGMPVLVANFAEGPDVRYFADRLCLAALAIVLFGALVWNRGCREFARMD